MVSKNEVLQELSIESLRKIAKKSGIQVSQGFTGFLTKKGLGIELRQPYIDALSKSNLVTLDEIDRILGTRYGRAAKEPGKSIEPPNRPYLQPHQFEEYSVIGKPEPFTSLESASRYILDRYLYKEDIQHICSGLDIPTTGNKDELINRIIGNPHFNVEITLNYIDKTGLKNLCDDLRLNKTGTREELEVRISCALRRLNPRMPTSSMSSQPYPQSQPQMHPYVEPTTIKPAIQQIPSQTYRTETLIQQESTQITPSELPKRFTPQPTPEPSAPSFEPIKMVISVLERYCPSQRFRDEKKYEIEVAQAMRHYFQPDNVKTQANIPNGRIDIEVMGVGVEIKVPASRSALHTLLGQVQIYRNYYGTNVVVLIFNDLAKSQDINEYCNILRGQGVSVIVK